jgi:hypothetical protein
MSSITKRQIKILAAVLGMFVMAIAASRQFYLFSIFRDAQGVLDPQGGGLHLWLAAGAALAATISGALMFVFFLRQEKSPGTT